MSKIKKIRMFAGMAPKLALNLIARQAAVRTGLPLCRPPALIDIKLTSLCNLRCRQCLEWQRSKQGLSTEQWKDILKDIKQELGTCFIRFYGGEPFCRPDLRELLSFCTDLGMGSLITTNATLIDDSMAEHLKAQNIHLINISIDGLKAQTHDRLRGVAGAHNKAIAALMRLKPHIPVQINTTIMKDNLDEIADLAEFARKANVRISFQGLVDLSRENNRFDFNRQHGLFPDDNAKIARVMDSLIAQKQNNRFIVNSRQHLSRLKDYYLYGPRPDKPGNCAIIYGHICIRHRGDVFVCGYKRPVGNLCRSSFKEVWRSKRAVALARQMKRCAIGTCKVLRGYHKESFGQWFDKIKTSVTLG